MKTLPIFLAGFLLSVMTLIGCDSALPEPATSRIRIFLTDAPRGEMVEANVLIERVELLGEGERVELLADDPQPFDLLTLQDGVTASLADVDVPDGTYHQNRIIVSEEATVVLDDGTVENSTMAKVSWCDAGRSAERSPRILGDVVPEASIRFPSVHLDKDVRLVC